MRQSFITALTATAVMIVPACADDIDPFTSVDPGIGTDVHLPIAFGLTRDQDGLATRVMELSDPSHPDYRQWMSLDEVASEYGSDPSVASAVLEYLTEAGFSGAVSPTGGLISGTISIEDASRLLSMSFATAPSDDGVIVYPSTDPKIPRAIAQHVEGFTGLNMLIAPEGEPWPNDHGDGITCPDVPPVLDMLREQYELPNQQPDAGAGMSIAVPAISAISEEALELSGRCYGFELPPVRTVSVDDTGSTAFGTRAVETTLDASALSMTAPGLDEIVFYQFNPHSRMTFVIERILNDIADGSTIQVISSSLGFCETTTVDSVMEYTDWLIASAAAAGVTTVASSGDDGSSGCGRDRSVPGVQYPAVSPYVTAVGGTQFATNAEWSDAVTNPVGWLQRNQEVVWNQAPGALAAGGGGESAVFYPPSYQSGVVTSDSREVPDVAFLASAQAYGYLPICEQNGDCTFSQVGGTSASAPGFAGALINLASVVRDPDGTPGRFGLINPALYALAAQSSQAFDDITVGNNDLYDVGCCVATEGFDTATGLGSLNVIDLADFLTAID